MTCNRPIDCYYAAELNPSGKRGLTFNPRNRYLGGDLRYTDPLKIPCGKCAGCKVDASLMWSIRSYHEASLHDQNCFVTLTYDDAHLPSDKKIDKEVLQKFFRRLRKVGHRIRYVACGEYGGLTNRPHYHAIIFGKDWLEGAVNLNDQLYTHPELVRIWGKGHVSVAPVEMGAICYVCGYVTKKMDDEDTFALRSNKPGIGHAWLDRYKDDIVRNGIVTIEGREYQVPKRYLLWEEEVFQDIKRARAEHAKKAAVGVDPIVARRQQDSRETNKKARIKARLTKEKV
jgi:hypothetical protein